MIKAFMFSPAKIEFVAAGAVGNDTNPTLTVPAGYTAGNLLVIAVCSGAAVSTPAGWSALITSTASPRMYLFYKISSASESSVVLTASSNQTSGVMLCYKGNGSAPADVTGTEKTGSSTSPATNSLTTTGNDLVISIYGIAKTANTWTSPASTNERVKYDATASYGGLLVVDEIQISAGASTVRTATLGSSQGWTTNAQSFKPG